MIRLKIFAAAFLLIASVHTASTVASAQVISTYAGNGPNGPMSALDAALRSPNSVTYDGAGNIYVASAGLGRVYRISPEGVLQVIAGTGQTFTIGEDGDGGLATGARFRAPINVEVDQANNVYITDSQTNRIRRVDANTGIITTVAGNGSRQFAGDGGPATSASLYGPKGVAIDEDGNLYIADDGNRRVRKVDVLTGIISTVAGGGTGSDGEIATLASLGCPSDVALDSIGNLLIADRCSNNVRKVDANNGVITTVAGTGIRGDGGDGGLAISANLNEPYGLAISAAGDIFVADRGNNKIRSISAATGIISTYAGVFRRPRDGSVGDGGLATLAYVGGPQDVAIDSNGQVAIADTLGNRIRLVDSITSIISTVVGTGWPFYGGDGWDAGDATFDLPRGVALDADGNLFIADYGNSRVRRIDFDTGIVTTVAGDGSGRTQDGELATNTGLGRPNGVAVDAAGHLYITSGFRVYKVNAVSKIISTLTFVPGSGDIEVGTDGEILVTSESCRVYAIDPDSGSQTVVAGDGICGLTRGDGGLAVNAGFSQPVAVTVDKSGNIFIADFYARVIRKVDAGTGIITTIAGTGRTGGNPGGDGGPATSATFVDPTGVEADELGNIYIAQNTSNGSNIRKIDGLTGIISRFAGRSGNGSDGDGGPATSARLYRPYDVAIAASNDVYIADQYNRKIRLVKIADGQPAATPIMDEASFNAAIINPTVVNFEGVVSPGASTYLGNPGEYSANGVTVRSNSPMFLQNNNLYGTGAFLSPQQSNPEIVEITLPPGTRAIGFSYQSETAVVQINGVENFEIPAVSFGSLRFFGATRDTPIESLRIAVAGPGIDLDDIVFSAFLSSDIVDTDIDGVQDEDDLCPDTLAGPVDEFGCADIQVDVDNDGYCDLNAASAGPLGCIATDNCPTLFNPDQADSDGDGFGDACVPPGTVPPGADIGANPVIGAGTTITSGTSIGDNADIGENTTVAKDSDIGNDLTVGNNSEIAKDNIIGDGVTLGNGVVVAKNNTIGDGVTIGNDVFIAKDVQIGDGTQVGDRTIINKGVVIGSNVMIGADVVIAKETIIPDNTVIPDGASVPPVP